MYQNLTVFDLLSDIIQAGVNLCLFIVLTGDSLKLRKSTAGIVIGCMYVAALLLKHGTCLTIVMYEAVILVFFVVHISLIRDNTRNRFTLYQLGLSMYNIIATVLVGGFYMIYSLIGHGSGWYVKTEAGVGMYIITDIAVLLSTAITVPILRKLSPTVLKLKGVARIIMFILIPIECLAAMLLKGLSGMAGEYSDSATGALAYVDFVSIVCFIGVLGYVIIRKLREAGRQKKFNKAALKNEEEAYRDLQTRQEELENLRHDVRNQGNGK